jgi:hypothetical protein
MGSKLQQRRPSRRRSSSAVRSRTEVRRVVVGEGGQVDLDEVVELLGRDGVCVIERSEVGGEEERRAKDEGLGREVAERVLTTRGDVVLVDRQVRQIKGKEWLNRLDDRLHLQRQKVEKSEDDEETANDDEGKRLSPERRREGAIGMYSTVAPNTIEVQVILGSHRLGEEKVERQEQDEVQLHLEPKEVLLLSGSCSHAFGEGTVHEMVFMDGTVSSRGS